MAGKLIRGLAWDQAHQDLRPEYIKKADWWERIKRVDPAEYELQMELLERGPKATVDLLNRQNKGARV